MSRNEHARFAVAIMTRMSYWMVAFLWVTELGCLPVAVHHPQALVADVLALTVTALFSLGIMVGPRIAYRIIDRVSGLQSTSERLRR